MDGCAFCDIILPIIGERERKLYGKIGNERGASSERSVERIVNARIEAGKVPEWLTSYEKASPEDDRRGIDGWFHTDVGKIPLQIKSSRTGKQHAAERKPSIPTVIVRAGDSETTIFSRCISAIAPDRKKYLAKRRTIE